MSEQPSQRGRRRRPVTGHVESAPGSEPGFFRLQLRNSDLFNSFLQDLPLLTLGTLLVSAGVYFFKFPNNFATGGVTGLAVLLYRLFPMISQSTYVLVMNIFLMIVGIIVIGREFGAKSIYASALMSLSIQVFEWVWPMAAPFTTQPLLELAFAVLMPGLGSALLFNVGASTGGTDVVAMIVRKYSSLDIGRALLVSDSLITMLVFPLFGMETGLMSLLGLLIKTTLIDSFIESFNLHKAFTVVTADPAPIVKFITEELKRGATVVQAKGAFSGTDRFMIMTILKRHQAVALRNYIHLCDEQAFMYITNTSEIIGKGFRGVN